MAGLLTEPPRLTEGLLIRRKRPVEWHEVKRQLMPRTLILVPFDRFVRGKTCAEPGTFIFCVLPISRSRIDTNFERVNIH